MSLAPRSDFLNLDGVRHLAAGSESPALVSQREALLRYSAIKGRSGHGTPGATAKQEVYRRCKDEAATLLGVSPGDVAFVSSAAHGISQAALSLPWQPGENVVVEDREFLSTLLPFTRLRGRGVEVRVVSHAAWTPDETAIAAAVDRNTRVIAVSQVNYLTGVQHDLERLRALADGVGARLVADVTHAAGAVPVPAALCDLTVSATYKWLLGCQGVALLTWNRARLPELEPAIAGWRSVVEELGGGGDPLALPWQADATRLEGGNPPWPLLFYLEEGLRYLNALGGERIAAHVHQLSARVDRGARQLGFALATPAERAYRAGNTCIWWENAESAVARLAEQGILIGGYGGRLRISTHIWNDEDDVDRCLEALAAIQRQD